MKKYKVKDYKFTYDIIEALKSSPDGKKVCFPAVMNVEDFKKTYKNYYIYSIKDFSETRSTSVIFGKDEPIYELLVDED